MNNLCFIIEVFINVANGASGYVLKSAIREELVEEIETEMKAFLSLDAAQLLRLAAEKPEVPATHRRNFPERFSVRNTAYLVRRTTQMNII